VEQLSLSVELFVAIHQSQLQSPSRAIAATAIAKAIHPISIKPFCLSIIQPFPMPQFLLSILLPSPFSEAIGLHHALSPSVCQAITATAIVLAIRSHQCARISNTAAQTIVVPVHNCIFGVDLYHPAVDS
jgi:hypothetical protein